MFTLANAVVYAPLPTGSAHIAFDAKQTRKRSAGNPHAAFEEVGIGT